LVSEQDAIEESGEVEVSDLGGLEETLEEFSNHHGGIFDTLDLGKSGRLDLFVLGGLLKKVTDELTEFLHIITDLLSLSEELLGVFLNVSGHLRKVGESVGEVAHRLLNWCDVLGAGENVLASWKTSLELLIGTNSTNSNTEKIANLLLNVWSVEELSEGLNSGIEHKGGLILVVDAEKKSLEVEGDIVGLEDTLGDLGKLVLLHVLLGLLASVDLGDGSSDHLSVGLEVLCLQAGDSGLEIGVDVNVVDRDLTLLSPLEGGWLGEGVDHFGELGLLGAVSLNTFGISHNLLDITVQLQEVFSLDILLEGDTIIDEFLDILEALGGDVNLSVDESLSDLDVLLGFLGVVLQGGRLSEEESSEHGVLHFKR